MTMESSIFLRVRRLHAVQSASSKRRKSTGTNSIPSRRIIFWRKIWNHSSLVVNPMLRLHPFGDGDFPTG